MSLVLKSKLGVSICTIDKVEQNFFLIFEKIIWQLLPALTFIFTIISSPNNYTTEKQKLLNRLFSS